jgi:hypothetical protein
LNKIEKRAINENNINCENKTCNKKLYIGDLIKIHTSMWEQRGNKEIDTPLISSKK